MAPGPLCNPVNGTGTLQPVVDAEILRNAKIVYICGLGFATLLASGLPWFLHKTLRRHAELLISLATCFAAGIILGGGFSHVLPDAQTAFSGFLSLSNPCWVLANYPFAPLLTVAVLFMLVVIDKVFVDQGMDGDHHHHHGQESHSHNHVAGAVLKFGSDDSGLIQAEAASLLHGAKPATAPTSNAKERATAWLFLVALSIHSIFDGLGLGAETSLDGFIGLSVAVVGHKLLDGVALGIPVYYAQWPWWESLLALVFCAAMTPLGIAVGWVAATSFQGRAGLLAQGIVLSCSAGSFVFISLMEMLPAGLASRRWLLLKLALAVLGWALMAFLAVWV